MRFTDVVALALSSLWQQRGRTMLSLVGVIVGSLILIFSLAAQGGIQEAVIRVFSENDEMRYVEVFPTYSVPEQEIPADEIKVQGEMSDDKRERIRKMLVIQWQQANQREVVGITRERLRTLESTPHVARVVPQVQSRCWAVFGANPQAIERPALLSGVPADQKIVKERLVAGSMFASDNENGVLIHEFLAYQWGAVGDAELQQLVGQSVRLEARFREEVTASTLAFRSGLGTKLSDSEIKALNRALDRIPDVADRLPLSDEERAALLKVLSPAEKVGEQPRPRVNTEEFKIRGVFRGATKEEEQSGRRFSRFNPEGMVLLPIQTATDYYFRAVDAEGFGLQRATVIVDSIDNLRQVSARMRELGYQEYSLIQLVESINQHVVFVTWLFVVVAGVALFVAGLGITNTMIMSVIERTHEIGVMKATGARDRQVMLIFLIEGALIGLLGAALALLISWGLSFGIDWAVRRIIEREINRSFSNETVLKFSWWVFVAVMAFSTLVTMLAAVIPARRAARISPVAALRHE